MSDPFRQQRLAALRDTIADIERKPALAEARTGVSTDDAQGGFPSFSGGLVQEIFTPERRNSGASLGFALAQAQALLSDKRLAVIYLQLASQAQELGLPYGPGLTSFGFAAAALTLVRPANMVELLWAAEEAIACQAVAAVVADIADHPKILDFTASRRLSLRTAAAGTSLFVLRYGADREASAAQLRWHVSPSFSARNRLDSAAPGARRWRLQLEKGTLEHKQTEWLLGWTEDGFEIAPPRNLPRPDANPPLPRPVAAEMGYRLSQTG